MKKKTFFLTLILAALGLYASKTKDEGTVYLFSYFIGNGQDGLHLAYSHDGLTWTALNHNESFLTPTAGRDKLMRDPCLAKGPDGTFHMVWTVSWKERGIGYASSKDLIHWSEQQYIPVMEHEPTAINCWAPEINYDDKKNQFIIYWATTIPGRFPILDTGDHDYNHRMYYVTTSDFTDFSKTKLLYDHGFNVIDATIKKNGKEYVMFLKDETKTPVEKNIRISTSKKINKGYSPPSEKITRNWVEGPTAIKIQDEWVVYFDQYRDHKMGAVKSTDLINWTDISDTITFPKGTRHGTVIEVDKSLLDQLLAKDWP